MNSPASPDSLTASLAFFARILLGGLAVGCGLIAAGVASPERPQLVPALAFAGVVLGVGLALGNRTVDRHLRAVGVRLLVAFHGVRFIGAFFLWAYAQGQLPEEFALRAGIGDIVVAIGALLLLQVPPEGCRFRGWLLIWNALGALDLVLALGTAIHLNLTRPGVMNGMVTLPWALIPLVLVPVMLATHAKIFAWLWEKPTDRPNLIF
jgi:hypothetical protein